MSNTYEVKKGIRNGAIGGLIAGLVMAIPMFAMNTVDFAVLIPTSIVIGSIYGILTSNNSIRPANTKDGVALGIITGLISFAILSKPAIVPYTESLVPLLHYVLFGAVLGWVTSRLANRHEQKIGVTA
jgi:uncharacterized membrane protein YeaQ/YmgE (transglycosylase-associated protein family)